MVVSVVGYFFSIITVFSTVMTFMALLIGVFNHSTFEKVRHYPHPRPIIEQTVTPTNPEPHHARVAPGTDEATPATDLSARDAHAASVAKTGADSRKSERKIKRERLAHLHQPKALARQQQNYEGYGYGMALGYAEGYHPGLDGQR
jgi:hypothetical protein